MFLLANMPILLQYKQIKYDSLVFLRRKKKRFIKRFLVLIGYPSSHFLGYIFYKKRDISHSYLHQTSYFEFLYNYKSTLNILDKLLMLLIQN